MYFPDQTFLFFLLLTSEVSRPHKPIISTQKKLIYLQSILNTQIHNFNPIFVHNMGLESPLVHQETRSKLMNAFTQSILCFFQVHIYTKQTHQRQLSHPSPHPIPSQVSSQTLTWLPDPIQGGKAEVGPVPMASIRDLCHCSKIVHVVETRAVSFVISREKHVYLVGVLEIGNVKGWINSGTGKHRNRRHQRYVLLIVAQKRALIL